MSDIIRNLVAPNSERLLSSSLLPPTTVTIWNSRDLEQEEREIWAGGR
jgi:hypothetical protein